MPAAGAAALAGLFAGVFVGGIGSRIAMRVAGAMSDPAMVGVARTGNGNVVGDITLGGTFALIFFNAIGPGLLGGVGYAAVRPWLAPFGRWGGTLFGLGLLAAVGPLVLEPFNIDFQKFGAPAVNVVLFALLFPVFGIAVGWALPRIAQRLADGSRPWLAASYVALALLLIAVALIIGPVLAAIGDVVSGLIPDGLRRAALLYVPAVALVARLVLAPADDARRWALLPRTITSVLLVLPVVLGAASTVEAMRFLAR